jgi:hypothetical protein
VLPSRTTIVGVRFMPGAGTSLLGLPADQLVDLTVPLWGAAAAAIGSLVAAAATPQDALLGVQRYLAGQPLRPDPPVAELVRRLMPWDPTGIASLADDLSLSESHATAALSDGDRRRPETFQRTLRFQGHLALAQAGYGNGPADLAAETGYAGHAQLPAVPLTRGVLP